MSFCHKKNVTKCLGHHYAIWTSDSNFLLAQIFFFGQDKGLPSFQALNVKICSTGTVFHTINVYIQVCSCTFNHYCI